jgi:lysophospholipase L1-like esterase
MPNSKIILLGALPFFEKNYYAKNRHLNSILEGFNDEETVFWLDMGPAFLLPNGHQNTTLYVKDLGHLSAAGYEVWQRTMEPLLNKLYPLH